MQREAEVVDGFVERRSRPGNVVDSAPSRTVTSGSDASGVYGGLPVNARTAAGYRMTDGRADVLCRGAGAARTVATGFLSPAVRGSRPSGASTRRRSPAAPARAPTGGSRPRPRSAAATGPMARSTATSGCRSTVCSARRRRVARVDAGGGARAHDRRHRLHGGRRVPAASGASTLAGRGRASRSPTFRSSRAPWSTRSASSPS